MEILLIIIAIFYIYFIGKYGLVKFIKLFGMVMVPMGLLVGFGV